MRPGRVQTQYCHGVHCTTVQEGLCNLGGAAVGYFKGEVGTGRGRAGRGRGGRAGDAGAGEQVTESAGWSWDALHQCPGGVLQTGTGNSRADQGGESQMFRRSCAIEKGTEPLNGTHNHSRLAYLPPPTHTHTF